MTNGIISMTISIANSQNGGYLLWPEMHGRATNPLEGEEQCTMNPLFDPRKLSCADIS